MAPKSKRGKEQASFDRSKFVSAAAHFRYQEFATTRKFIVERSFYNPGGRIEEIIVAQNWQRFCYFTAVAVIPVVREFYANFKESEYFEVFVRGVGVQFSPERINIFYGLPPTMQCYYSGLSPSEGDLDMIITYLTDSPGAWKIRNGKRVNFSSSKLNGVSKAWHYFISARLLPSNHISEVTKERAILNYCIQERKPIDVGNLIYETVDAIVRSSTAVGLGFPSLIYSLCRDAGVEVDISEEKLKTTKPIGKESVSIYDRLLGKRSTAPPSSVPSTSRPSTSRPSVSSAEPPSSFWEAMHDNFMEQQNELLKTHCRIDTLDKKFDHLADYTVRKSNFDADYTEMMTRYIRGDHSVEFPTCPRFSLYQDPDMDFSFGDDDDEATASDK